MDAVRRRAKDEWLALFAEDAVVEDPVGPSHFSPDGTGHHGRGVIGLGRLRRDHRAAGVRHPRLLRLR